MSDVTKTKLYRALKPCIRKEDHAELRRMLEMVWEYETNDWTKVDCGRLSWAFPWGLSPQGSDYWSTLSNRLRAAGFGEVA
jgi:hypothetical protein